MSKKKVISEVIEETVAQSVEEIESVMLVREEGLEEATQTTEEVEVFFGKGDYAITSANIDKLISVLDEYNNSGLWKWSISDVLGIKPDGAKGKKYYEIKDALRDIPGQKVFDLIQRMSDFVVNPKAHRTIRATKEEKEARRAEVAAILNTIEGISEAEKSKMLKVI